MMNELRSEPVGFRCCIFVIAGSNKVNGVLSTIEVFDTDTRKFTEVKTFKTPRLEFAAAFRLKHYAMILR